MLFMIKSYKHHLQHILYQPDESKTKCPRSNTVFVSMEDFNFGDNDDFTYFSAITLNRNNEPEVTFRFDRKTDNRKKWIQE